ncbi:glycosyltransferase family 39 protein [Bellilinea caldifistulae]|nr:glycosyltransferase family 39 protein [Bellilinea caldifistulae]
MDDTRTRMQVWITSWFWLLAAFGTGVMIWTAAIPADEKGSILLGFSAARLILLSGLLGLVILCLLGGWLSFRNRHVVEKINDWLTGSKSRQFIQAVAGVFTLIGWLAAFMPAYWFRIYQFYFVRLQPLLVWLGLAGLTTLMMIGSHGLKNRWRDWKDDLKNQKELLRAAGITFLIFALIWLIAATTGLGINAEPYFWDEASVPLLAIQIVLCTAATLFLERRVFSSERLKDRRLVKGSIFLVLWLFTFLLWYVTPLKHSYFAPGPRPPNYLFYPYSDSEFYDLAAQYILIGQGVLNGIPMDKPLYALFLSILHAIAGQGYEETINLQIAVLALMPPMLYLLGSQMVNRPTGLLMGLLAAFHQRNAIAATPFIKVSHSKLYLTEYPTALLLVIFALFAFRCLKKGEKKISWADAVVAGGFLGLAMLIRPNALMVLPFVLLLVWVANRRQIKPWLLSSAIVVLMVTLTVLPFMLEIPKGFNEPYLMIKIRAILETRILTDEPRGFIPLEKQVAGDLPFQMGENEQSSFALLDGLERFAYVPRHFFHNMIMTIMLLPNTFALHDLRHTLEAPYWKDVQQWTGELPPGGLLFLPFNLLVLAVGVGAAWQRNKAAGLVPLMMLPGYFLANSLARNSGWRYLVPMDWVVLVYFAIGLLVLLGWVLEWLGIDLLRKWQPAFSEESISNFHSTKRWNRFMTPLVGVIFVLVGLSLPLNKVFIPDRYPPISPLTLFDNLNAAGLRIDREAFREFINSPNAYLNYGLGLYPRFYPANSGEPQPNLPLKGRPYPRFTLTIVAWDTFYTVLLPMEDAMPNFPHGEDVIVMGCKDTREPFIDAYAIVVLSDPPQVYQRDAKTRLVCPFPPLAHQP